MTRHRAIAAGLGVLATVAGLLVGSAPPGWAATGSAGVRWSDCPAYSDGAIASMGVPEALYPEFRALLARTQCGTVLVPLDYRKPGGSKIAVAITRLRASDQQHKLGSLAMNPGGPGGSGYLMPINLLLRSPVVAELAERYDLIGFDPRGSDTAPRSAARGRRATRSTFPPGRSPRRSPGRCTTSRYASIRPAGRAIRRSCPS
ncbi:hypothetical protein [Paractinoplanes durhamensis]|uniref:hypothetical protein n=1 Tax=Paractinoplanes durhamensis TaxID=113563 RepID=UPI00364266A0